MCELRATLWKHYWIRFNGISSIILTIAELLSPIIIFSLVIYTKSKVGNLDKVYVNTPTYVDSIPKEELLTRINIGGTNLLFAPNTTFTFALIREVQLKLQLYNEAIKPFITKEELLNHYNSYEYDGSTVVILFKNDYNSIPHHLEYNIKIYEDGVIWNTDKLFTQDFVYTPGMGSENYLHKGFAPIQIALDISFIEMITNSFFNTSLTFQEFPYPPYLNTDGITTIFRHILPFLTIISFIFICPVTLKRIVLEKSSGLKELLKITGVKPWMLWFGWFLNGILINAISAVCIAVILTRAVFCATYPLIEHCNVIILALFLILYCSATITFLFAFSTMFNRGTLAMILGVLAWIISYVVFIGVATNVDVMSATVKTLFLLLPPIALYYGFHTISTFEIRETDITFYNLFDSPTTSYDDLSLGCVVVMLLFDTVLYFLLTLYLDKVWPGPYGISKPWYFILLKPLSLCRKNIVAEIPDSYLLEHYEESNLNPLLRMNKVVKMYDNNVAVDNLTLDIYEGTVTSLLGENGAGKSTTMSMLIGLTKATSGDIFIGSYRINDNVEEARKSVSICTQHDLLYDELNVIQHLILFGMLRGLSRVEASNQAQELLNNTLKLYNKRYEYVSNLSGGMKRKLSLGIALMGDPKILILDEPTSGIDIEGRREIWDLILSFKTKKTILVSTHFLEEAEYLSDYIAIIDNGRLLCYGTPMYLKKKYNVGYNCIINYNDDNELESIQKLLAKYNAIIEKKPGKVIRCCFNNDAKKEIPKLLRELDNNRDALSISYKFFSTTLEDIYLKVQGREKTSSESNTSITSPPESAALLNYVVKSYGIKRAILLKKKALQYSSMTLLFFVVVFLTFILGESKYADISKDGTKISLTLNLYGSTDVYYSILGNNQRTELDMYFKNIVHSQNSKATKVDNVPETIIYEGIKNIAHYMKRMIVATEFTFDDKQDLRAVNLMYSNKAIHGAPISINIVMNALLKYFVGDDYSISTSNTPLHSQNRKTQSLNQSEATNMFLWLTLLPIGPLILVSTVLLLPTIEHSKSTRILENLCGITSINYWLCYFIWDFMYYFIMISVLCIMLIPVDYFEDFDSIKAFFVILVLYGLACIPFAYTFTYSKTVESAYSKFLIVHILCAPIIAGVLLVLEEVDVYKDTILYWKCILFALNPHLLLCYLLSKFSVKMISNHNWDTMPTEQKKFICAEKPSPCCDAESKECIQNRAYIENDIYLTFVTFFIYLALLLLWDSIWEILVAKLPAIFCDKNYAEDPTDVSSDQTDSAKDAVISVDGITKTYLTASFQRVRAIKQLTFQVLKGKCFGLLGVNGAGKSTSFRILTSEIRPTKGLLRLKNMKITIGYCPQHNALLDDFTGRQLLQLYGRLRKIREEDLDETIKQFLEKFGLTGIADKPCGIYSGGNKRKLSTCISVIGKPECILLDEPTNGVDPMSRRELWDLIDQIKQQKDTGIVLSSHSMDECEVLCDNLCILKDGKVKVNSPINKLKKEYCKGHIIKIKFKPKINNQTNIRSSEGKSDGTKAQNEKQQDDEKVKQFFNEHFKSENIVFLKTQNALMHVRVLSFGWPAILEKIEMAKSNEELGIDDYWVKEASLEEAFMQIAEKENVESQQQ